MSYYQGGGWQPQKWNYLPNLDRNLLATVREEMIRKEEEQRRELQLKQEEIVKEQQRKEEEQRKYTNYLTALQAMVRELPGQYKRKLTYDVLSSIATSLLDGTVFEIVKGLQDIQQLSERNLHKKRIKLINNHRAEKAAQSKKNKERLQSCEQRPHHIPVVEKKNAEEMETLEKRQDMEVTQLDQKIILELDQVVLDQQATLQRAGVPLFCASNNADEVKMQMYILDFIARLAPPPGQDSIN